MVIVDRRLAFLGTTRRPAQVHRRATQTTETNIANKLITQLVGGKPVGYLRAENGLYYIKKKRRRIISLMYTVAKFFTLVEYDLGKIKQVNCFECMVL